MELQLYLTGNIYYLKGSTKIYEQLCHKLHITNYVNINITKRKHVQLAFNSSKSIIKILELGVKYFRR